MLFKSVVQSLFKLSGSQAYPASEGIAVDLSSGSFIAPHDGYLLIGTNFTNGQDTIVNAWGLIPVSSYGAKVCNARIAIPCAKGQIVYFSTSGVIDVATFVPSKGSS